MSQRLEEDEFWLPPKMRCVAYLISSLVVYHTVESLSTECFPFLETSAPSNSCDDLRMRSSPLRNASSAGAKTRPLLISVTLVSMVQMTKLRHSIFLRSFLS